MSMTFKEFLVEVSMEVSGDPAEDAAKARERARMAKANPRRAAQARMDTLDAEEQAQKSSGVRDPKAEQLLRMKKNVARQEMMQASRKQQEAQ